ncbi:UDP-glucose 4-epimerase GalE [Bacteriovorax stolpii]|uniref:UDP-glucose 4-epimerase n=1 Tax=Bacteriovorax stolpii TaxID=960 RepID=A0A2K9NVW6_BACTC|nr:UDP-glucose 4-epimerase GalE [Bacteriovorax stolpii]AUN99185.1 UDP-glucose 4-epimerase GalE [Bacteriovorax stolpii]QDK40833.1 UDP-glucose 4-epimerase GalE [Bacteriovorax stolpii]TDP55277.1 UDP-galactose 4-epimerase [Bacteriovorax stolpii]
MSVLVTGGAGYIGSHVVSLLGEAGKDIIILDNLTTGRPENILYGKLIIGDLRNQALLDQVFTDHKIEAVLHFAGSIVVPESVTNPTLYYQNNTENSAALIKTCLKHGVKKFIFSSTAAVYGMPESGVASEETPTSPINPYGRSKLMTEWMLEDVSNAHDFSYVALRYFNVAGASKTGKIGQSTPRATHLLKTAAEVVTKKRAGMSIFGTDYKTKDGTCIRDYIHVDDLAQAHLDALSYLDKGGKSQVLNCGYGHGFTVKEVIGAVESYVGQKLNVEMGPRRAGDAVELISKAEKIKTVLGWQPKYNDLDYIVKSAIEWEKKLK